jgi:uncharacterized membrane protein YbaN (DUF454 family)
MIKLLWTTVGTLSLGVGALGLVLPVLPATPFFLLSAYAYWRGSERLHTWLLHHPTIGPMIRDYLTHRGLKRSTKIKAIAILWISIGLSMVSVDHLWLRIALPLIALASSTFLLHLKTLPDERNPS